MKKLLLIVTLIMGIGICAASAQERLSPAATTTQKQVRFYPNPANVVINFELQKSSENQASLLIFNFMGKKVYEQKNIPAKLIVNLENFYRGIYVFQLRDKNGIILDSGKFQVVK